MDKWQQTKDWVKQHLHTREIISAIIGVGLFTYIIIVATQAESFSLLWNLIINVWSVILVLSFPYLLGRFYVWMKLLERLDIKMPLKLIIVAYATGELVKTLPLGDYLQSYVLNRFGHFKTGLLTRSYVATTGIFALESLIAIPTVILIGIPGWYWLPWVLGSIIGGWFIFFGLIWLLSNIKNTAITSHLPLWLKKLKTYIQIAFVNARHLINFKTLLLILPTIIYLLAYTTDLYIIIHQLGFGYISYIDTISIFLVSILIVILLPVTVELGVVEISGVAALLAYGVPYDEAAAIMLSWRIITTGVNILIASIVLFVLRRELSRVS